MGIGRHLQGASGYADPVSRLGDRMLLLVHMLSTSAQMRESCCRQALGRCLRKQAGGLEQELVQGSAALLPGS